MLGCIGGREKDTVKLKVFASWQADGADLEENWTSLSLGHSFLLLSSQHPFFRSPMLPVVGKGQPELVENQLRAPHI